MRRWAGVLFPVAGTTALLAMAGVASSVDGKAAFERREDTMKHMGRPFYLGIGRVVKGTTAIAVGMAITGHPPQSGRIEARTGLRMMPTSPHARQEWSAKARNHSRVA
jgi:hypothetical protein